MSSLGADVPRPSCCRSKRRRISCSRMPTNTSGLAGKRALTIAGDAQSNLRIWADALQSPAGSATGSGRQPEEDLLAVARARPRARASRFVSRPPGAENPVECPVRRDDPWHGTMIGNGLRASAGRRPARRPAGRSLGPPRRSSGSYRPGCRASPRKRPGGSRRPRARQADGAESRASPAITATMPSIAARTNLARRASSTAGPRTPARLRQQHAA